MNILCYSILGDFLLCFSKFYAWSLFLKKEKNFKRARESESSLDEEAQTNNESEGQQSKDDYFHQQARGMETRNQKKSQHQEISVAPIGKWGKYPHIYGIRKHVL